MAGLSAFLPVEQGVACWAALKARVDALKAAGDPRTRGQIAADTLVERLTGQATAGRCRRRGADHHAGREPARPRSAAARRGAGFGPIPAGLADEIIGRTSGRALVAAAVHRTDPRRPRQHDRGRGPGRAPVHRLARQTDQPAGRAAGNPSAPPRSGISTTSSRSATVAPPATTTAAECANTTTTYARCRAGRSTRSTSRANRTPPSPPPRPDTTTSAAPPTHSKGRVLRAGPARPRRPPDPARTCPTP